MRKMIFALSVIAAATVFATDSIDFSADGSELRPLLHSTCFNANVKDHNAGQEPYLTNGGFASSETILWSEGDFNQRVTDIHHIFPLVGQDPDDAANYFFAASDRKLFYAARCNLDVMYRLGSAKESAGYNAHTLVPTNFANTAKVMSHIISHYTASKWADGIDYSSRISRWEIWSGPDDPDCWWAPNRTASELRTLFVEFFVTCLKQIKTDHPTVKVGGPALSKWDPDYMGAILDACDAEGVYPDFISYQCYTHDADALLAEPATIRAWLDSRGANYANCEIILSAWHYLPDEEGVGTLTQLDMDKVHEASLGEGGTMTATAAAFNLAVLSGLQNTPLARAYHGASTAFSAFSPFHWSTYNTKTPHVAANAFKLFGTVTKDYTKVLSVQNDGARSVLAVANDASTKGALLVTDSSTAAGNVEVPLTGLSGVSGLATKVVNASNSDVQTLSSGATLTATGATIAKQAGPQAYLLTFDTIVGDEPEPVLDTYDMVGSDPGGANGNSWTKSCSAAIGWKKEGAASVDAAHTVSSSAIYILGNDTVLRSPHKSDSYCNAAFAGAQLVLRGGELALQSEDAANTVTVPRLVGEGGKIIHYTSGYDKTLNGGIEVRDAGLIVKINSASGQNRNLTIASTITGSGPISLMGGSGDSAAQWIDFAGDMSGFTGTISESDSSHMKNQTLKFTGSFGGTITALPAGTVAVVVNYAGLPSEKGLRVASTTIPTALKTKLTLFGETDFTAANLPLMTFPAGTTVDPAAFTVKYASMVDGTATAFENLGTVENADGTITLVASKSLPPPSEIEIPTGANRVYNGQRQTGVEAGVGYTLSGTFAATAVGNYTATATLNDPENTKWTDETTAAKTINWSITKATNGWKTEPSLSRTSWPANQPPATLNVGAANFGTMTATLGDEPFDLANPVFPTEEGEYTLVITVAGSNDYDELVKEITFTITEPVDSATYYLVGQEGAGKTSFFSSSNPSESGWAETEGGAAIAHDVAAGNNYVIPAGTAMRTAQNDNADTFLGDTLKLAGEIWFKKAGNTASPVKVLSIPKLIADGGTLNNEKNDINAFEIQGGLEIPEGKTLTVLNQGDTTTSRVRNFKISSTTTGSGTLYVSLGGSSTSGTSSTLELAGDWSGFTGQVAAASGKTKLASWTFIISGAFGGAIESMPDRSSNPNYVINLANNPEGIRIAGDALPTCLRYRTCFYGADFANGTDIKLLRVPKTVRQALTSALEFKWAASYSDAVKGLQTGSPSPTALNVSKISFVDNRDGTETYVYNRTTFYEKLANDTRTASSSYATGGDYIYKDGEDYIHVFKNGGTFTPSKDLTDVQVLVVGGGGSGGYASGGGGGAGGLVYRNDVTFAAGTDYTVTVGAGGAKKTSSGNGNNGDSSSIGDITAPGGGGGAGMNSAGISGGSGGGGSGDGKSGGAGTADKGFAGGAGGLGGGSYAIGGGGGGAGEVGWAAGTQGPTQSSLSTYNAGCGGDGLEKGSAILGYEQFFAGGGGGGTAGGEARVGTGGLGGGGRGGYDVNNVTYQTPGEDGLGGGGGGGAINWGGKDQNGAAGGKGIVIVRYPTPYDLLETEITGTIEMSGWTEGETPSEPDLTGLAVTPEEAAPALLVMYYANAECTQALEEKPALAGTYYVRAEIEKTRRYKAAVSEATAFTIKSSEKTVVLLPTVPSFVYDGTPKTCVEAGEGYTIDGSSTVTATDVGDYSVTLKLVDSETSQWSDFTTADKVIPWSIAQAANEWTTEAAIDKVEWMQRDAAGDITTPAARLGTVVATLNGEPWNGEMPTAIGSYTLKWTVAGTANYTGLEAEIAFTILRNFDVNAWSVEPSITKTSWKSTDAEPGVITPPSASFGGETLVAEISSDGVTFAAWDGTMPTAKGAYTIRWTVAATEDYSELESSVEFLIDYRYRPTHPFMYQKAGDNSWKGANTFKDAVDGITGSGYVTATIELCQDVTDTTGPNMSYRHITLCSNPDDGRVYTWTRPSGDFTLWNGSTLTIRDLVLNLTVNGNLFLFTNGGGVTLKSGAVLTGSLAGTLCGGSGTISFTLDGGALSGLTSGTTPLPGTLTLTSGVIENCTVSSGAIIAAGGNTLNLSNVTITNNVTTAGAITVGAEGKVKVRGDVIVRDNKTGEVERNIVLKNAANLEMTAALGANAAIGVSFGNVGDVFGSFAKNDATGADMATAKAFFNDLSPKALSECVNTATKELFWRRRCGIAIIYR